MMREVRLPRIPRLLHGTVVVAAALLFAPSSRSQEGLFTPQDVSRLRQVTAAEISPDGSRAAYVLGVPREPFKEDDGPAWTELHVVTAEGVSRPYVTGQVNVSAVSFRPGGKEIAFLAKRGKDEFTGIYAISIDGGEARKLIDHKADIASYSFEPDGKRVAFLAAEPLPKEKKELRDKGFNQEVYEEDWRPVRVWIARVDEKEPPPRALDLPGTALEVRWSPADSRMEVTLAPTPLADDGMMNRKARVVDADAGKTIALVETPGKLGQVAWSPDGKHLALISAADRNDPQEGRLMAVPASGGDPRDLIPGYKGHVTSFAWRDARTLAFTGDEGVWSVLGEVALDGSGRATHVPAGASTFGGLTLSRDGGTAAWLGHGPRHPAEVFLLRIGEGSPRRLTDSNPWLARRLFAKQEVLSFKARDGLDLEGILVRPLDEAAGKRYPLILTVHGGPEAHVPNGWVTSYANPGQVAAARGFAVFYPNYRGSTGRGVEFSKLGQADAAGKEFDDLVDAVDRLVASGLVDGSKVGITGGSYGGYASAWGATRHSERFAASVMFVGISDLVSKTGTTDIPDEMCLVHHRKRPWEDWEYFRGRSPIFHVEKARTPILILHGKDDPRVHPSQSLELFRQLKVLGRTPVRLVLYPGEGHGNRRAASRLDYSLRLLGWMEHYLKGPGGPPPPFEIEYGIEKPKSQEDKKKADL